MNFRWFISTFHFVFVQTYWTRGKLVLEIIFSTSQSFSVSLSICRYTRGCPRKKIRVNKIPNERLETERFCKHMRTFSIWTNSTKLDRILQSVKKLISTQHYAEKTTQSRYLYYIVVPFLAGNSEKPNTKDDRPTHL